jgi:hypothetical protein
MRALRHLLLATLVLGGSSHPRADTVLDGDAAVGVTPSLGRGYTPAIAAYHSICFGTMPTTKPSFDFDYTFEAVERQGAQLDPRLRTHEVNDFISRNTREKRSVRGKTSYYFHYMLATLVVDSYYSSINEAQATVSKDALALLGKGDLVSFFTSCGTHYVRSISRRSLFLTLFSYATTQQANDLNFERKLEQEVRRLGASPAKSGAADPFVELARTFDLKVITRSVGLDAQKSSALLPFDLATYQQSVRDAFKAAQDEHTGRITSMEILPWLSNTQILVLINAITYPDGNAIDWNERKRILSDNAEFYIELSQHLLDMTTDSHRAEACRQAVQHEAFQDHKLRPEYANATIVNDRTGESAPLRVLLDAITDQALDRMRATGLAIRNGADGTSGAAACMAELERTNLGGRFHNEVPSCKWSREPLPGARIIDEYCPPRITLPAKR